MKLTDSAGHLVELSEAAREACARLGVDPQDYLRTVEAEHTAAFREGIAAAEAAAEVRRKICRDLGITEDELRATENGE